MDGWGEHHKGMRVAAALPVALLLVLTGCAGEAQSTGPAPQSTTSAPPEELGPVQPVGDPEVVAEGLQAPWSIVPLDGGGALVSERDSGLVQEVLADGTIREVGPVPGVVAGGEGGLLGLALFEDGNDTWLYAYLTAAEDNRIMRLPLEGAAGSFGLGDGEVVVDGFAKASNHNGGRIAFGPDGMLYATVGDAGRPDLAQDPSSPNGKILRLTPEGDVPEDNPSNGSPVYSLGHRNPQGIAWDRDGRLWAAEFGQNTWDEINLIEPGANYGWPEVEGAAGEDGYVDPVHQWPTSESSPSGLAFTRDTFFLAALRGERVWALYPLGEAGLDAVSWFTGEYGRIRDVSPTPDGDLWFVTNNTDGRGEPSEGDDRIWRVRLGTLQEG